MNKRITKRVVDALEPGHTAWDGELPGFGVRANSSGGCTYVLKYRSNKKQRWYTIGKHGHPMPVEMAAATGRVWTPSSARDEAVRLLGRVRGGADPAFEKQAARKAETLREYATSYLSDHVKIKNKPATEKATRRKLDMHILPKLGHIKLIHLTRNDIARFHRGLKATPYQANRCLALLSHILSKAEAEGVCPDGSRICKGVDRFKERQRQRFLSFEEVQKLAEALNEAEAGGANPSAIAITRLLLLTGARRNEIEGLRWQEVEFGRRALRLADSKTGPKQIALPSAALAILSEVPRVEGAEFVFPAASGDGHFQGIGKIWRKVRHAANLDDVRLHDLRHTFASFGAAGGLSLPLIGALLGHSQAQTTQRYAHLADEPVQRAADQVGRALAAAMEPNSGESVRSGAVRLGNRGTDREPN